MAIAEKKLVTADELMQMSAEGRLELVRGEVIEMPPTGFEHGDIAAELAMLLRQYVIAHKLGKVVTADVGFHLQRDPDIVRAPDVAFVANDAIPTGEARSRFIQGPPTLAVEVVSPSDTASDIIERVEDYLRAGAKLVWVIYPSRQQVVEYRSLDQARILRAGDRLDGGDVIPGFSCAVGDIFGD